MFVIICLLCQVIFVYDKAIPEEGQIYLCFQQLVLRKRDNIWDSPR